MEKRNIVKNNVQKSQLIYVILALFLGAFGVHNFYADRWERGIIQLLITVFTGFLGLIISSLWAIINIFSIETDGTGRAFIPNLPAKYICGVLGILKYLGEIIFGIFLIMSFFMETKFTFGGHIFEPHRTIQESYEKIVTPTETIYKTTQTTTEN